MTATRPRSRHAPKPLPASRPLMQRRYRCQWEEAIRTWNDWKLVVKVCAHSGLSLVGLAHLLRVLLRRKVQRCDVEVSREF